MQLDLMPSVNILHVDRHKMIMLRDIARGLAPEYSSPLVFTTTGLSFSMRHTTAPTSLPTPLNASDMPPAVDAGLLTNLTWELC